MKNTIILIIVLIIIGALVYAFAGNRETTEAPQPEETAEENTGGETPATSSREVRGTVVSVNTDQVPVDGPAVVTIREENGMQAVVAIRSMGINFCPAQANI